MKTFSLILGALLLALAGPGRAKEPPLEPVRLSADGRSFVLAESGRLFRIWGVNYDRDSHGDPNRLLEDYWFDEWDTVRGDFREMKQLGANVVRIHLQLARFMAGPETADEKSLVQLARLLSLAEETGLYLDLTGLGCYRKADVPAWYDALDEAGRWAVQARFWTAVARTCRDSPAVFCYDLMNEPVASGKPEEGWLAGELGGYCYVQRLTLTPGQRTANEIAAAWARQLTAAIRAEDPRHLITVGAIAWALTWPQAKPVFYSPEAGRHFDFVSIHVYPQKGEVDRAIAALKTYDLGKPLLIEETFPLSCSIEEMGDFLTRSRDSVAGYVSFYWGRTAAELENARENPDAARLVAAWLREFARRAQAMK